MSTGDYWLDLREQRAWNMEASRGEVLPGRGRDVSDLPRAVRLLVRLLDSGAHEEVKPADMINLAFAVADGVNHNGRWGSLFRWAVVAVHEFAGGRWPHRRREFRALEHELRMGVDHERTDLTPRVRC